MQPVTVAMFALPAPAGAQIMKLPADAQPTEFDVWIERPGANLLSWPGKNADGTVLVGRIPLAGGAGRCCVVSRQTAIAPGSATLERPTEEQLTWMQDTAAEGRLYCKIIGDLGDETAVCCPANVRRPRLPLYICQRGADPGLSCDSPWSPLRLSTTPCFP
jgi:hypothetical protein